MSWETQLLAEFANLKTWVENVIATKKTIDDYNEAVDFLANDYIPISRNGVTMKMKASVLTSMASMGDWIWINDCFVVKAEGKTNLLSQEDGDAVYNKVITNNGDTLRLFGHIYKGSPNDDQLRTSYDNPIPLDT